MEAEKHLCLRAVEPTRDAEGPYLGGAVGLGGGELVGLAQRVGAEPDGPVGVSVGVCGLRRLCRVRQARVGQRVDLRAVARDEVEEDLAAEGHTGHELVLA